MNVVAHVGFKYYGNSTPINCQLLLSKLFDYMYTPNVDLWATFQSLKVQKF